MYYGRAVEPTILPALHQLSTQQAKPTKNTEKALKRLFDFLYTYPNATIRYYASDMKLHIDTDAAYLVLPQARSRIAGHYYLSNTTNIKQNDPPNNGPVLTECTSLKGVVASAAEAETGGIFKNCQNGIIIRRILHALGHSQPPTPVKTDNSTAASFVHSDIIQKKSKTWDMRWNWLKDRQVRKQFEIYWRKGTENLADYFTKHHSPAHHRTWRNKYILKGHNAQDSTGKKFLRRGCIATVSPTVSYNKYETKSD